MNLPTIDFEGVSVNPGKTGYKCPFDCGDKRFPQKKWKTEKGFRQHMKDCWMKPSLQKSRDEKQKNDELKQIQESESRMQNCPYRIGDTIFFVRQIVLEPTHKHGKRVRYEAVISFIAEQAVIDAINWNQCFIFNGWIPETHCVDSMQIACSLADEKQKQYDNYLRECRELR